MSKIKAVWAALLLAAAVAFSGCQTIKATDPKSGLTFEHRTFLMKQGPKEVTFADGPRQVTVKTGERDQTAILQALTAALGAR